MSIRYLLEKELVKAVETKVNEKESIDLQESWNKDLVIDILQTKAEWEGFDLYF